MGCVIDNDAADQLTESFLALMMRGGRPIRHLERPIDDRPFLRPALIDTTDMAERPDIALFGPVLQVIRAHAFDSAIAQANNPRYGLPAPLLHPHPPPTHTFLSNAPPRC